ncbi:multiple myeloma tumor-associated protein 2-like [Corticium candelabrum]|uniref:multiple myeloma tumor-associated protein 2-like n=1 Tax=Corticium candelabrum TaxID=121492 RepID=UPI002E26D66B|nr:multiple myeloma tumor-associated protein 2-like [Corticium candelabrum]
MAIALGHKKSAAFIPSGALSKSEIAEMCKRGSIERDGKWVDRVEGMGFTSSRAAMVDVTVDAEAQKRGISVFQEGGRDSPKAKIGSNDNLSDHQSEMKCSGSHLKNEKKHKHKKKKDKKEKKSSRKHKHKHESESDSETSRRKKRRRHASNSDDR